MSLPGDKYFCVLGVNAVNRCYNGCIVKGVNTGKEIEMTTWNQQLIEILTSAFEYETKSLCFFEYSKGAETKGDTKLENHYWVQCQNYDGRAQGLLDAYEVLTGRKIFCIPSRIREEIETNILTIRENYKSESCPF